MNDTNLSSALINKINHKINSRKGNGTLRYLTCPEKNNIDFSSNDYLGFGTNALLKKYIEEELSHHPLYRNGSGGSRLISGNTEYVVDLEKQIASFHKAECGLIFNSGYEANLGLFSAISERNNIVLYDEKIHASVKDGIRLGFADHFSFKHNDLDNLESKLKKLGKSVYVVVESVYSMDGDLAPLKEISTLVNQYQSLLIVDEAHATGIYGEQGRGLVNQHKIEKYVFARVVTFGKALGVSGAIVLGESLLIDYLVNYSRPFIYTTAMPFYNLVAIKNAYRLLGEKLYSKNLFDNIQYFNNSVKQINFPEKFNFTNNETPIQAIIMEDKVLLKSLAYTLNEKKMSVRAIFPPTVKADESRIRICLHFFNTKKQINSLLRVVKYFFTQ